jgi:hypothetical protein
MRTIATEMPQGRQRNKPIKDHTGARFGKLLALSLVARDQRGQAHRWLFRCDCGTQKTISVKSVVGGHTRSCGCLAKATIAARNTKHGLSRRHRREYRSWKDMRGRCNNPKNDDYPDYGGRGIRVCQRWDDFAAFLADMGERPEGKTLDRIDVNGGYEPGNCRWADAKTQANNKRLNMRLTIGGASRTLQQWSEAHGVGRSTARWRLRQGWPLERAFSPMDFRR